MGKTWEIKSPFTLLRYLVINRGVLGNGPSKSVMFRFSNIQHGDFPAMFDYQRKIVGDAGLAMESMDYQKVNLVILHVAT